MTKREVKRFFRRRGLSQNGFARELGVAPDLLSRWLRCQATSGPLKQRIESYIAAKKLIEDHRQPAEQPQEVGAA